MMKQFFCLCSAVAVMMACGLPNVRGAIAADDAVVVVESPGKDVQFRMDVDDFDDRTSAPVFSVSFDGRELVSTSPLGLALRQGGLLGEGLTVTGVDRRSSDTEYKLFPGKAETVRDHYNEAVVRLEEAGEGKRRIEIQLRAYDDGVAFRYHLPAQPGVKELALTEEATAFQIDGDPQAYALPLKSFDTSYEAIYEQGPVSGLSPGQLYGMPMLMQYPDGVSIAITEAHLEDFAGMYLTVTTGTPGLLSARLSPLPGETELKVKADLPHSSPWRVILIGDDAGKLVESNLVTILNPSSRIADTSWIKPGKTTFPWWNGFAVGDDAGFKGGLNTETMLHYIDFCAEVGIEYHSLDGVENIAWYGGPIRPYEGADITTTTLPDLDLEKVLSYAKEKNVKLRLWMHWEAARQHMEKAFPVYEQWGIEGIMLDFIDRDDQEAVKFVQDAVELAAKHRLTITLHGIHKPTGLTRTYPNLLTYEGVRNLEYNKWKGTPSTPNHELIVPFTRMLAGPLDYHSGGFRHVSEEEFEPRNVAPVNISTRARELARYVVYEGYLPMAADFPAAYRGEDGLGVLVDIPTHWHETRVLNGKVGDTLTIARRHGDTWYVGSMNNGESREVTVPLTFLGSGRFSADVYGDKTETGAEREELTTRTLEVSGEDSIAGKLAPAGGHLVILSPM